MPAREDVAVAAGQSGRDHRADYLAIWPVDEPLL
jgi:hypothetical protein